LFGLNHFRSAEHERARQLLAVVRGGGGELWLGVPAGTESCPVPPAGLPVASRPRLRPVYCSGLVVQGSSAARLKIPPWACLTESPGACLLALAALVRVVGHRHAHHGPNSEVPPVQSPP